MRIAVVFVVIVVMCVLVPAVAEAQMMRGPGWYQGGPPYGHSCPGPRWGRPYGARRPVASPDEAKQVIETFFSSRGQTVTTGKVEERQWYYEVEVLDASGAIMDKVIVDKRTGRLRSIY